METVRKQLDDAEFIEDAITDRLRWLPELYMRYNRKWEEFWDSESVDDLQDETPAASKELMSLSYEISLFMHDYFHKVGRLHRELPLARRKMTFDELHISLQKIDDRNAKGHMAGFTGYNYKERMQRYSMFGGSTNSRDTILSQRGLEVKINDVFKITEQYGQVLDLTQLHQLWMSIDQGCSYLKFLNNVMTLFLDDKKYVISSPSNRNSPKYVEFVHKASRILEDTFFRYYNLLDRSMVKNQINSEVQLRRNIPFTVHENKGVFCCVCDKWFTKLTVYNYHLPGARHYKHLKKRQRFVNSEYKLHRFLKLLSQELTATIETTERKMAMTPDERMEEMKLLTEDYNLSLDYEKNRHKTSKEKVDSSALTSFSMNAHSMPKGPDGLPIPRWLYKLQGLDRKYVCEICGNKVYRGRRAFDKHFNEAKHQFHLECLGIKVSSLTDFRGITKLDEVLRLWEKMQQAGVTKNGSLRRMDTKYLVEVEDKDGNVMSQKVYEDLKRQGMA